MGPALIYVIRKEKRGDGLRDKVWPSASAGSIGMGRGRERRAR